MPQPFLETGQHRLLVADFGINDAVWMQSRLGNRWRKQILAGHAPKHLSSGACHDTGRKQCGRCTIDSAVAAASDLVERAERQPAARQPFINNFNAEWQIAMLCAPVRFDKANPFPNLVECQGWRLLHRIAMGLHLVMFVLCSLQRRSESSK